MKGCAEMLNTADGFTHVICATGTGTTLAGLALAATKKQLYAEGICVLKNAKGIDEEVRTLIPVLTNWKIHHEFHRGGYAKSDPELLAFIRDFASRTGILLDHVYTAKMMMAVLSLTEKGHYPAGASLLLIHTGGLLGSLSVL
jgi:1-aminocyclopropane-1-carboxylate deaminase